MTLCFYVVSQFSKFNQLPIINSQLSIIIYL